MAESKELNGVRRHLVSVEKNLVAQDSEIHLIEGFDGLEDIALGETSEAVIARRLGNTYLDNFRQQIKSALTPRDVPEPVLKQLMRLSQILDSSLFANDSELPSLTATIARRFIDALFEGYSDEEKQQQIQRAMDMLNNND